MQGDIIKLSENTELNNNHSCDTYDDECICKTCEIDVTGYPQCKSCNRDKGMMLG